MQSETYNDGTALHQVFEAQEKMENDLRQEAGRHYRRAMAERFGKIKEIKQTFNIGRNDPCPCGSGRKFKKCHLGLQIPDRATV